MDNQLSSLPFLHPALTPFRISLNTLTLNVKSDKVYTRHGVPISVTGIAQVSETAGGEFIHGQCPLIIVTMVLSINALLFSTDEDSGSEQTDAGCSLPDVHGEVRAGDRSDRLGDTGGAPAGHHRPPDC